MSERVAVSEVDSDHLGVRIARARIGPEDSVDDVLDACRRLDAELLVVRCDAGDLATVHRLERGGFELMDTLVEYAFDLAAGAIPEVASRDVVRPGDPGDADAVGDLAAVAFAGHRGHYQADERLDRAAVEALYPAWARASCLASADPGEIVVVTERGGRVIGFATARMRGTSEAVGLLAAVAPEHRGSGVYRGLLARRLSECRSRGAARAVVSTQLSHLPPQHAWTRLGYELAGAQHTFHRWLDR